MKTYSEKLKDPRWQKKRLEVLERDEFACRDCGGEKDTLHVHHCFYEKGDPWETNEQFLLTLCEFCHDKRTELESDAKRALGMMFSRIINDPEEKPLHEFVRSMVNVASDEFADPVMVDEGVLMRDAQKIFELERRLLPEN